MIDEESRVFIVDDDASFLTSVARLFRRSGFQVKTHSSAEAFLADPDFDAPGCVVADLQMPGLSGMELQCELAKTTHPMPIVFLTGCGDIPTSVRAMRQGAEDFLTKRAPKEELLSAVQRALERDRRERHERARRLELQARFDRLTPRDREVLVHVLRGRLNKQTAAEMGIDERSVKRHRTSLMSKLEVASVAELSHLAHEAEWPASNETTVLTEPAAATAGAAPVPKGTVFDSRRRSYSAGRASREIIPNSRGHHR